MTVVREAYLGDGFGLHARPAARVAEEASRFASEISIESGGREANCKSVVALLRAGIRGGTAVRLRATGHDEAEAAERIAQVLEEAE